MLVHLAHPDSRFSRRLVFGLSLVLAAGFAAKDSFAVEAVSVLATAKVPAKDVKPAAKLPAQDPKATIKDAKAKSDAAKAETAAKAATEGSQAETVTQEKGKGGDDIDFTSNAPIDPIPALGDGTDDFQDIDKRAAQYAKEAAIESDDARVERELKEYKEAAVKAETERAKAEAMAREAARASAREEAEKAAPARQRIESEAERKARELEGIEKDDLNWKGLED